MSKLKIKQLDNEFASIGSVITFDGTKNTWSMIDIPDVPTFTTPDKIVYVAKNGDDINGDGSFFSPYESIKHALSTITNAAFDNKYDIILSPGIYVEDNPIIMKQFVNITANSDYEWGTLITPLNVSQNLFEASINSTISNIGMADVTDAAAIHVNDPNPGAFLAKGLAFSNVKYGIQVLQGFCFVDGICTRPMGSMVDLIRCEGGLTVVTTITMGFQVATNIFNAFGSGTTLNVRNSYISCYDVDNVINVNNGAHVDIWSSIIQGATMGARVNGNSKLHMGSLTFHDNQNDIIVEDLESEVRMIGSVAHRDKMSFVDGYKKDSMFFQNLKNFETGIILHGDLAAGRPTAGKMAIFGEGRAYTNGMVILTTDNTASTTVDGGNFIDITSDLVEPLDGNFGSFQGNTENYSMLIGTTLGDGLDKIKHWGLKILQNTAALEETPKSFVFERWTGTQWKKFEVMATHSTLSYSYGNRVFIRTTDERIRYGLSIKTTDWVKTTINGQNLYWIRIRIVHDLITVPLFEQIKLIPSILVVDIDGTTEYFGQSRFRETILATGNIFGQSGGVTTANIQVGFNGIPTGWAHNLVNCLLNGPGDAVYTQFTLPKGIDTSMPIKVSVKYQPMTSGASTNASFIISVLPIEVESTNIVDPSGGLVPIPRSLSNTVSVVENSAQTATVSVPITENTKIQQFMSNDINISDFYDGDIVVIRIEMDGDGSAHKDIAIWGIEISAVSWSHGERI